MKKFRLLPLILLLVLLFSALSFPTYAAKSETITQTVNLANVTKNASGAGFTWANIDHILTLDGLNIETNDQFGMKLPKDATVILKGDNRISASEIGLVCSGHVTFEGTGTLTIIAGDVGMDCTSVYANNITRLSSGNITIEAGNIGIRLETADFSLFGGALTVNITGSGDNNKAISGRNVLLNGGKLTANAGIYASNQLQITSLDATVSSSGAALECPNGVRMNKVDVKAGASSDALASVESYNGENAIKLTSTASNAKKGILFDAVYPRFFDYLIFAVIIAAVSALIIVPIYIKRKKTERLIAEYNAAHPQKKKKTAPAQNSQSTQNTTQRKK